LPNKNIKYNSKKLLEFFSFNRQKWDEFYPSERWVFDKIGGKDKKLGDVLDVGCACGGLGAALDERFILASYTGVDVHRGAIDWARRHQKLSIPSYFITGDILEVDLNNRYDIVVSLSCADWNIEAEKIINTCWEKVDKDGYFVISLRLTALEGINNIKESYQYINPSGKEKDPEIANYVVFNFKEIVSIIKGFSPSPELIGAYGYWGKPATTAVTPFDKLVFAVFYIKKPALVSNTKISTEFNLPEEMNGK
jgi:SAM-dependent methyltransferase